MKKLHAYELCIEEARIPLDDSCLLVQFHRLSRDVEEKKQVLDRFLNRNDKGDYLSVAVARLAYEFTKEQYNALYNEVVKRGLLQVC